MADALSWLQQMLGAEVPPSSADQAPSDTGPAVLQRLQELMTAPQLQSHYDPNASLAQNALNPAAIRQAMDVAMSIGPGAIRAYHYSPNEFSRFDLGKAGSETDPGMMGRALYFSTDPAVAKAGPHRYEVDLDIKSPLNVEHPPDYRTATKSDLVGAALDLPPPTKGALAIGKQSTTLPEWQQWAQNVAEAAKARGHDAAVLDYSPAGYQHKEIAVYDPSVIQFLRKYGLLPPLAGAGLLGSGQGDAP